MPTFTNRYISEFSSTGLTEFESNVNRVIRTTDTAVERIKDFQRAIQETNADPMVAVYEAISRAANRATGSIQNVVAAQRQLSFRQSPELAYAGAPAGLQGRLRRDIGIEREGASVFGPISPSRFGSASTLSRDPVQFAAQEQELSRRVDRIRRLQDLETAFGGGFTDPYTQQVRQREFETRTERQRRQADLESAFSSQELYRRPSGLQLRRTGRRTFLSPGEIGPEDITQLHPDFVTPTTPRGRIDGEPLGRVFQQTRAAEQSPFSNYGQLFDKPSPRPFESVFENVDTFNRTGRESVGIMGRMVNMIGLVTRAWAAWGIVNTIADAIGRWVSVQVQLNDALANYAIVTGQSRGEAEQFVASAFQIGLATGTPIADTAPTLEQIRRVGLPDDLASRSAEVQRLFGTEALPTSRELVSISRQFPDLDTQQILDSILGAYQKSTFSSPKEIFDLLDVAGPTSQSLGTSFPGYLGLTAGATTVTSLSPNQIELGIRRISGEYADAGSEFRTILEDVGVATVDASGNLRDFVEVFFEVSEGVRSGRIAPADLERLSNSIPNVLGTAFGEMFTAMISNSENVRDAVESSQDSIGKWADALTIKMDTLSSASGQLSVAFDLLLSSLGVPDFFKGVIQGLTSGIIGVTGVPQQQRDTFTGRTSEEVDAIVRRVLSPDQQQRVYGGEVGQETRLFPFLPGVTRPPAGSTIPSIGGLIDQPGIFGRGGADAIRNLLIDTLGPYDGLTAFNEIESSLGQSTQPYRAISGTRGRFRPREIQAETPIVSPSYRDLPEQQVNLPRGADLERIKGLYETLVSQREQQLSSLGIRPQVTEEPLIVIDQFSGQLEIGTYNLELFNQAIAQAGSTLQQQIFTIPQGVGLNQLLGRAQQVRSQLDQAGFKDESISETFFTTPGGQLAGVTLADSVSLGIASSGLSFELAESKRAQQDSLRVQREQLAELRKQKGVLDSVAGNIGGFVNTLASPSAVTESQFYLSSIGGYQDQFDEPVRRLRAVVENRLRNQPLEHEGELARAQAQGFFPGFRDLQGPPEELRQTLRGQLGQFEESFYGFGLPLDYYDLDAAVDQFGQFQQRRINKEQFTEAFTTRVRESAGRGEVPLFTQQEIDAFLGKENRLTEILFGDLTPDEVGNIFGPYGEAVAEALGGGALEGISQADYVAGIIDNILDVGNMERLLKAGSVAGGSIAAGVTEALSGRSTDIPTGVDIDSELLGRVQATRLRRRILAKVGADSDDGEFSNIPGTEELDRGGYFDRFERYPLGVAHTVALRMRIDEESANKIFLPIIEAGETAGGAAAKSIQETLSERDYVTPVASSMQTGASERGKRAALVSAGTVTGNAIADGILIPLDSIADRIISRVYGKLIEAVGAT